MRVSLYETKTVLAGKLDVANSKIIVFRWGEGENAVREVIFMGRDVETIGISLYCLH